MWQNIAFILIGIGVLALVGWAVEGFFTSSEIHILVRVAVGVMGVGVLILIGVAIKDRVKGKKDKDIEGVER